MALLLTDDELIAAVAMCQARYDGPIPTVAMNADGAAVAAVWRGQRSLSVRDLIGSDGSLADSIVEIVGAFGSPDVVEVYAGDESGERTSMDLSEVAYRSGERVLVERTSPTGVHAFAWVPGPSALEALTSLLTAALESRQIADPTSMILAFKSDRPMYARVGDGLVSVAELNAAGGPATWATADETTLTSEIRRVLGV